MARGILNFNSPGGKLIARISNRKIMDQLCVLCFTHNQFVFCVEKEKQCMRLKTRANPKFEKQ